MNNIVKLPFYAKLTLILLSLICVVYIIYIGQAILIPIMISFLFAILLGPIVLFFKSKLHFPHVLAVIITVLFFVVVILGVFAYMSLQINNIVSDFGQIQKNIGIHIINIQHYIKENFQISKSDQNKYLEDITQDSIQKGKEILGTTLLSFTDTLLNITLIPIYIFLILLYRTHFIKFLSMLFEKKHHSQLQNILFQIKITVKSYIVGLILEMILVSALTALGLLIIGVKYAMLLGIITGILNIIPYIGILFAGILTILASLTSSPDLSIIFGVIGVNLIVQLIDNNIIFPMIVSSKVEINAFVTIIGIIIGGAIAGISGMFLAIPILAILKVIFDNIDSLEPWGYLIGDNLPKTYTWRKIRLPLFDSENVTETFQTKTDNKVAVFTENTTEISKD